MSQYINKDRVVAEIERRLNSFDPNEITSGRYELVKIRDFLNTLGVKEVDLEKELDLMITSAHIFHQASPPLMDVAKHFYELGLKAQKGE